MKRFPDFFHQMKCYKGICIPKNVLPGLPCRKHGIIGPYWFEDANERAETVNTERYLVVVKKFWAALGQRGGVTGDEQWFQKDGATPHTSNDSLAYLRNRFPNRLISRICAVEWAPHSPDLNLPDFYLWGFLKNDVYKNSPQTIPDLKRTITATIRGISQQECVRIVANFARRVQVCFERRGGHFEHVL